jgi:hypothetical protein
MRRFIYACLASLAVTTTALSTYGADLSVEARLIWGANDEKETVRYEPLDTSLSDKLHRDFKWKNYYEITNRTTTIPLMQSRDLRMSDACTVRVKNLGSARVEVSCIGRGKQVHRGTYTLERPQWLVLGGNSTDNTAWFVGLRVVDKKVADATH